MFVGLVLMRLVAVCMLGSAQQQCFVSPGCVGPEVAPAFTTSECCTVNGGQSYQQSGTVCITCNDISKYCMKTGMIYSR